MPRALAALLVFSLHLSAFSIGRDYARAADAPDGSPPEIVTPRVARDLKALARLGFPSTNGIKRLTPQEARNVVEGFPGVGVFMQAGENFSTSLSDCLPLNGLESLGPETATVLAGCDKAALVLGGLTTLDAATARALAAFQGGTLWLSGLTTLHAEAATALAEYEGVLHLDGLETLDAETATSLAAFKGRRLSLCGVRALDAATAKALAAFKGGHLGLEGLRALDAATAEALAEHKGGCLLLSGVRAIDAATAKALADFTGEYLDLRGLTTLDAATARALAEYRGSPSIDGVVVETFLAAHPLTAENAGARAALVGGDLHDVTALDSPDSVAIAQALATRKGRLSLPNLQKISPKTLAALIEKDDVEIPLIETLELIPEPDGSPTDDFVIPDWLEARQQHQPQ